jgi:hypothetical protein
MKNASAVCGSAAIVAAASAVAYLIILGAKVGVII